MKIANYLELELDCAIFLSRTWMIV